jgi:hypothetical protein
MAQIIPPAEEAARALHRLEHPDSAPLPMKIRELRGSKTVNRTIKPPIRVSHRASQASI